MSDILMHLDSVGKVFCGEGPPSVALEGITFSISKGEYVVIKGPSGSGKSTLLSIIGLLEDATTGSYLFGGRDVSKMSFRDKARVRNTQIGFVFQNFNLIGDLSVADNVAVPLTFRNGMAASERAQRVREVLKQVGVSTIANKKPRELSGGEQQRVAVARAVAGSPSIVLADEPTGNLDTENGQLIMDLLTRLNREGSTICLITHEPRWIESGRRILHLLNGRIS